MVYPLIHRLVMRFASLYVKEIKGTSNLLKDRPFLVASNHASYFDDGIIPAVILYALNKRTHIYTNNLYYKIPLLKQFLETGECIPIDISKTEKSKEINKKAFQAALDYLKKNEIVGVFPEGHRSKDANLQKAKPGVAKLTLAARVPVVPIGIIGSYEILPKGKILPRFRKCVINVGEPIYFEEYYGRENDPGALHEVTLKIMKQIASLSGKEYGFD